MRKMRLKFRATDPGTALGSYRHQIWVCCPKCDGPAFILRTIGGEQMARLSCIQCHYSSQDALRNSVISSNIQLRSWAPRCFRCGREFERYAKLHPYRKNGQIFARVNCSGCRCSGIYPAILTPHESLLEEGRDPFLGYPLYLKAEIGTKTLWALNLEHLEALQDWLSAKHRERNLGPANMTMMARLPRWMKSASARPKILRAIEKLQQNAAKSGMGRDISR